MNAPKYLPTCLEAIQSIPMKEVKKPAIPVAIYIQEAEELAAWSTDDAEKLKHAGLPADAIDELRIRAGALKEAQTVWKQNRSKSHPWLKQKLIATELRNSLLRDFRYAFREDKSLQSRLAQIAKGNGYANMIQDLNDLAVLGSNQLKLLNTIGFEASKLEQAAAMSIESSALWADYQQIQTNGGPGRYLRDQAYVYLKIMVDKVRSCGQYVFPEQHERYHGYCSTYLRQKNRRRKNKTNTAV